MSSVKRKKNWGNAPKKKFSMNENRFKIFEDYYEDDDDTLSEAENDENKYKVVIPPIVVDAVHGFQTVYNLIGRSYQYKRTSVGTRITSQTLVDYDSAKRKLISAGFTFYSHESKNTKLFKLVLYGLPKMDLEEIKEELKTAYNVDVVSIKEIVTKLSTVDDALYMLEFDRTKATKKDVQKVRLLGHIVVRWKKPKKFNNGPTQCSKCTMYGHGAKNCYRKNVCVACSGNHDLAVCQVNKTLDESSPAYKCFNCIKNNRRNTNHRADDRRCPSRKDYLTIRENIYIKSRPPPRRQMPQVFENSLENFPQMPGSKIPTISHFGYSEAVKAPNQHLNTSSELFNIDELFNIFTGAIADLRKCESKMEQISVIMTMLKYAV